MKHEFQGSDGHTWAADSTVGCTFNGEPIDPEACDVWPEEMLRLAALIPKCDICGKPASCLGQYDTMPAPAFACDDCCGHGSEDGWCNPLAEIPDHIQRLQVGIQGACDRIATLETRIRSLSKPR